jgi:maltose alpha-D-glucosyltransferase/alpha-amylase
VQHVEVNECIPFADTSVEPATYLVLITVNYADGEPDSYCVPITILNEEDAAQLLSGRPQAGIARVERDDREETRVICEATWQDDFWDRLLSTISGRTTIHGNQGVVQGFRTAAYARLAEDVDDVPAPKVHGGEQSNTSAIFGERFILKLFRRITPGVNPDLEIGRQLTERGELAIVPQVAGAVEFRDGSGKHATLAVLHQFVSHIADAWTYTLDELERYLERVQSAEGIVSDGAAEGHKDATKDITDAVEVSAVALSHNEPPQLAQDMIGGFLSWAELLGRRTGELHVALANSGGGAAFAPEPFTRLYQRGLYQSMRSQARATVELLRSQLPRLNGESQAKAAQMLECERSLYAKFGELTRGLFDAKRIRCHGDLHLGQVLFTGTDFVFIDFEGEPERPVSERRIKASALRDVAGMLRSFHYAAHAAIRGHSQSAVMHHAAIPIELWANYWSAWVSASFLREYLAAAQQGEFLPKDGSQLHSLLRAFLLEKALYELRYELNNRPDWVSIPLEGIRQYCGDAAELATA